MKDEILQGFIAAGSGAKPAAAPVTPVKIYYPFKQPIYARAGAALAMLEWKGLPYEWIGDMDKVKEHASGMGAQGDTFGPPIIVDGNTKISQQVAVALYIGKKCGFMPTGSNEGKVIQYMLDVVDVFEDGWGQSKPFVDDAKKLREWVEGARMKTMMNNIERSIKGPFYFGNEPCTADFFLFAQMDWKGNAIFKPLMMKHQVDILKDFPKIYGVFKTFRAHDSVKNSKIISMEPLPDEIINAYKQ